MHSFEWLSRKTDPVSIHRSRCECPTPVGLNCHRLKQPSLIREEAQHVTVALIHVLSDEQR